MDDPSLAARLARFLEAQLPDATAVRVTALERSTEGFSQETFTFDVDCERGGRSERSAWVAKREPVAGLLEPYDLEPEFRVLHALSDDPLPSPPTPWFTRDPAVLDRPFYVMARLPGDVPVPAPGPSGNGPFADADREPLAEGVIAALARLHAVDWRARGLGFLGDPGPGTGSARAELGRWRARIAASGLPMDPPLAEALAWLAAHVPSCDEVTLVHGDFRLGNFLVARDGPTPRLSGVLDWEMVHLGDPLEDVAWCASPMWRAGTPLAAGLVEPAVLAARYAAATGRGVDPARLAFYDVLAIVKMIAIMMTGLRAYRDGRTTDPRMAIFDHQLPFLHLVLGMVRGWLA
jgi:aminoglycoside phosphotransferase (APT) family kinase protein